ncbi:MAG: flagellin [Deltaproteobacteria bacterium]|nr:flagellin [Deltaproteobacteria bacterium]
MSLVVNHNLMAQNAARNLGTIYGRLAKSTERLSSGLRVNSAADDAAGLAIREFMRADIAVLNQGIRNASDAISMIQTAEGAMNVIDEKLTRMKELAEQSSTGTYTTAQREIMDSEYQAMAAEIDRIANATDFNGVRLLDGSLKEMHAGSGMKIHFGTGNSSAEDYYFISMDDMRATSETGLRVGNSDPRDTLRTSALNAISATSPIYTGTGLSTATQGFFGIRYSNDFDSTDPASANWTVYGYVDVDPAHDSINDIVQRINLGRQATGTLTFAQMADSTEMAQQSMTINGNIFTFASAAGIGTYDSVNKVGVINISGANISAGSLSLEVSAYLNTYNTSIGVNAVYGGSTLNLFATEWGEEGNGIDTAMGTNLFTAGQIHLLNGGEKQMTASVWYDENAQQYELAIQMDMGGERNQVQIFNLAFNGATSAPAIVGGAIPNTSMAGQWGVLYTDDAGGVRTSFQGTDELDEWVQAQNGSGHSTWDGADIRTQSGAQLSLAALDRAITMKDIRRAEMGAYSNRLENTITNLQIQAENLQASESRISDVDVATEMTEFTRNNILAQAAVAMLAQANSLPTLALSLLGG